MKIKRMLIGSLICLLLMAGLSIYAQVSRPYHNGSVWTLAFIRMKPGMDSAYLDYIATDWKRNQEESKKAGLILSYKVFTTESHNPGDFNIILMTEYKNMATLEANEDKADALAQRVVGNDEKQRQGYRERLEIREVLADRLAREIVLEPRR
jgi:hypothetical protein